MAQATRVKVKRMLGIQNLVTTHDDAIDDIIGVADQIVLDDLGLITFGVTTYSESMSFDYSVVDVGLTRTPVVSVVALTMTGSLLVQDTDYFVDTNVGFIELKNTTFQLGVHVLDVTYTAGFSVVPSDITYASNLIACSLFNQQSHVGLAKETAGNYSYSMDSGVGSYIPSMASRILNKYRQSFARGMKR